MFTKINEKSPIQNTTTFVKLDFTFFHLPYYLSLRPSSLTPFSRSGGGEVNAKWAPSVLSTSPLFLPIDNILFLIDLFSQHVYNRVLVTWCSIIRIVWCLVMYPRVLEKRSYSECVHDRCKHFSCHAWSTRRSVFACLREHACVPLCVATIIIARHALPHHPLSV